MTKFIDFSGARPGARAIKESGAAGVLRYLSADQPATAWKRATKQEIEEYLAYGLDVILNFEWYQGRMLEGFNAGVIDGKVALKQAKQIGYPKGATIYFSHDTSAVSSAVISYLRGARSSTAGYYDVDIYSGLTSVESALNAGVATHGWQTLAWSYGKVGRAAIYQNGNSWFNNGADEDIIRHRPIGSWLETINKNVQHGVAVKPAAKPGKAVPKKPAKVIDTYHVVKPGEYLQLLATYYKTTVAHLVELNKKTYPTIVQEPNNIKVGWKLLVVNAVATAPKPAPKKPVPVSKSPTAGKPATVSVTYHTVNSGEALSELASYYKTSVEKLVAWNSKAYPSLTKHPDEIYPSWRLRVR